jgi:uncharacterized protein YoxC
METLVTVFIAVAAVAIVLQMFILLGVSAALKKTSKRVDWMVDELNQRGFPLLQRVQGLVDESSPKINTILDNMTETSSMMRGQVQRIDATVNDIVDRTRLQVIRADEMVSRTMDRVEETTSMVQHRVLSPVRHASGLMQAVSATVSTLMGRRNSRGPRADGQKHEEELFI